MRSVSIGIDIGTSAVTTAVMRQEKSGALRLAALTRSPARGMRRGTVIDPAEAARSIGQSVGEAARLGGMKVKSALVGFSGAGVVATTSRGVIAVSRPDGEVTAEDVGRAMQSAEALHPKNANRDIIHIVPEEFRVDSESGIRDPVGMAGMRLEAEALILDAQKSAMQSLMKACETAGVEIEEWLFSPIAAAEAVLTGRHKELGAMVLDIGGGTSDYAVFEEGRLVDAGMIPLGGERITHDIAVGLRTHVDVAEEVKRKYGSARFDTFSKKDLVKLAEFTEDDPAVHTQRELAEIIQARVADIFELVEKALRRVNRQSRLPGGVVLIGGTAQLPGLCEFAREALRLPVERGAVQGVAVPEEFGGGADVAVAVGLTLWHFRQSGGFADRGGTAPFFRAASGIKELLRVFLP